MTVSAPQVFAYEAYPLSGATWYTLADFAQLGKIEGGIDFIADQRLGGGDHSTAVPCAGWNNRTTWIALSDDSDMYADNNQLPSHYIATYGAVVYEFTCIDGSPTDDVTTRIVSVSPFDGEQVSTTTPLVLSADIYTNYSDWLEGIDSDDDLFIRFKYARQQDKQLSVANPDVVYSNIDIPINIPYYYNYSTTTDVVVEGVYNYIVEIRRPSLTASILGWFGLGNVFDFGVISRRIVSFTFGLPTALDVWIQQGRDQFDANNPNSLLSTSTLNFAELTENCNPFSTFDIVKCIFGFFFLSDSQASGLITSLRNSILLKAPLGYITRLSDILASNATSTLPTLSVTIKDSSPFGGEYYINFDQEFTEASALMESLTSANSFVVVSEPKGIWDIFMPWLSLLGYIGLLFLMLRDIIGLDLMHNGRFGSRGSLSDNSSSDDSYRLKETLYNMSKRK